MSETRSPLSRRTLTKGSAWAAPVVLASASIPVYAASPKPTITSSTQFGRATGASATVPAYSCSGRLQIQISQNSSTFVKVDNIPTGYTLSNLVANYWFPVQSGTTFSRVSGTSTCWTVPTATGNTTVVSGYTFREYRSTYTCPLTYSGTSWAQPSSSNFSFISSCQPGSTLPTYTYHYTQTITLTSRTGSAITLTKDNGWANKLV